VPGELYNLWGTVDDLVKSIKAAIQPLSGGLTPQVRGVLLFLLSIIFVAAFYLFIRDFLRAMKDRRFQNAAKEIGFDRLRRKNLSWFAHLFPALAVPSRTQPIPADELIQKPFSLLEAWRLSIRFAWRKVMDDITITIFLANYRDPSLPLWDIFGRHAFRVNWNISNLFCMVEKKGAELPTIVDQNTYYSPTLFPWLRPAQRWFRGNHHLKVEENSTKRQSRDDVRGSSAGYPCADLGVAEKIHTFLSHPEFLIKGIEAIGNSILIDFGQSPPGLMRAHVETATEIMNSLTENRNANTKIASNDAAPYMEFDQEPFDRKTGFKPGKISDKDVAAFTLLENGENIYSMNWICLCTIIVGLTISWFVLDFTSFQFDYKLSRNAMEYISILVGFLLWHTLKGMPVKGVLYALAANTFIYFTPLWGFLLAIVMIGFSANRDYYLHKVHGENLFTKNWWTFWLNRFPQGLPKTIIQRK
jgi:hypothetical protein